jgi:ABC-2 type transport system ATP-binding protein
MAEAVFKVRNVWKAFGRHVVLRNVTLDIAGGEILGIIGPSGSGKTTLLNTLVGFLTPSRGDVLYRVLSHDGFKATVSYRSVFAHRNEVKALYGFASQEPSFYKALTVKENLEYFGSLYNLSHAAISANVNTLLGLMDLKAAKGRLAAKLSGGMERRLDIACSLMHDPEILILDEPTANLDPMLRHHIWELVRKINRKGTTVLLCSHHLSDLEDLCSRVGIIAEGRLVALDSPTTLKNTFAKSDVITVDSYPGEYDRVLERVRADLIRHHTQRGTSLVVTTESAVRLLPPLLAAFKAAGEHIVDLSVAKPDLEDVFEQAVARKPASPSAPSSPSTPPPSGKDGGAERFEILTHP